MWHSACSGSMRIPAEKLGRSPWEGQTTESRAQGGCPPCRFSAEPSVSDGYSGQCPRRSALSLHKGGIRHIVTSAFCKGSQLTGVQWGSSANGMGWGLSREPPELDPDSQAALGHRPCLPPLLFLCDLPRASHPDRSPRNRPC